MKNCGQSRYDFLELGLINVELRNGFFYGLQTVDVSLSGESITYGLKSKTYQSIYK